MLRQAVERTGGRQVKTLGDGVLAVFGAADAVACAVAMQQAVDGPARLDGIPLSIRIGLALGDLSFEEDGAFGTPVVQAARLVAAVHPGQILVTDLVRMVAGGRTGAAFFDKGLLELKGLPEPVAACEVAWERLATHKHAANVGEQRRQGNSGCRKALPGRLTGGDRFRQALQFQQALAEEGGTRAFPGHHAH